jgi:hypothetical protein
MIIPVAVRGPGILAKAIAIIRGIIVPVAIIIPVVQFAPAGPVMYFHPQVAVIIILVVAA